MQQARQLKQTTHTPLAQVVITSLMLLLYHGKGSDNRATNLLNDSTLLYMWSMLPAFAAAAYVPSLVMERPLFTRHAPQAGPRWMADPRSRCATQTRGCGRRHASHMTDHDGCSLH